MKEESAQQTQPTQQKKQLRGLYSRVNISVQTLNKVILALVVLLVACMAFGISKGGYQVTFDSLGGTAVESQKRMYGELVEEPAPPSREGYLFDGWYLDSGLTVPWDMEEDTVSESMTLYAGWKER